MTNSYLIGATKFHWRILFYIHATDLAFAQWLRQKICRIEACFSEVRKCKLGLVFFFYLEHCRSGAST